MNAPVERWSQLCKLGALGAPVDHDDKDVIARRGDEARAFWFHEGGLLEVFQLADDGRSYLARILVAPSVICLKECLAGEERYLQTVRTLESARLVRVERDVGIDLLRAHPELAMRTLVEVSRAFCGAARLEANRMHSTDSLLAQVLLGYVSACGEPWDGHQRLRVKRTQADLADCIGANERSVNRTLTAWKAEGLIDKKDARYMVTDPARLRALVEQGTRALVHRGAA